MSVWTVQLKKKDNRRTPLTVVLETLSWLCTCFWYTWIFQTRVHLKDFPYLEKSNCSLVPTPPSFLLRFGTTGGLGPLTRRGPPTRPGRRGASTWLRSAWGALAEG